ncbi:hypothetical protein A45J_1819 [hot springs metagenome]|uniref:Bacteriophage lambda Replication protein O N-terminal domain-containing protein n=1 Tax=hot springs metagenome TaxID=433727 RepID=A0A5J4L5E6_9ZZZZ
MASPQVENGYTRIANELLDAMLATEFTGREFRILLAIIRYSYGWNKKEARLTVKQIHQVTGISDRTIYDILRRLIKKIIITPIATDTYQLQKDYSRWQIDQRRYKPIAKAEPDFAKAEPDFAKATQNFSESKVKNLRKQCKINDSATPLKSATGEASQELAQSLLKDIFKDIYKDISLKERIFERLKTEFSYLDATQLKALVFRYPERADFFLYLCETFKIDPVYVKNPIAYITSLRPIAFPNLMEREEVKRESERKACAMKNKTTLFFFGGGDMLTYGITCGIFYVY